ncbi:unnamed protein product, partial [Prorocentrum cordatum]
DCANLIESFVRHYAALGFCRLLLYLDDPSDAARGVLEESGWLAAGLVELVGVDGALREAWRSLPSWQRVGHFSSMEVQSRQILNGEHALGRASEIGADWLLHVDCDELLLLPEPAPCFFAGLSGRGCTMYTFSNVEGVPEAADSADVLRSVRVFRQNLGVLPRNPQSGAAFFGWQLRLGGWFISYENGKSAVSVKNAIKCLSVCMWQVEPWLELGKPQAPDGSTCTWFTNNVLLWEAAVKRRREGRLARDEEVPRLDTCREAVLLHFCVCDFVSFWRKRWTQLGYLSASDQFRVRSSSGAMMARFYRLQREGRLVEARELYETMCVCSSEETVRSQVELGILLRADPQRPSGAAGPPWPRSPREVRYALLAEACEARARHCEAWMLLGKAIEAAVDAGGADARAVADLRQRQAACAAAAGLACAAQEPAASRGARPSPPLPTVAELQEHVARAVLPDPRDSRVYRAVMGVAMAWWQEVDGQERELLAALGRAAAEARVELAAVGGCVRPRPMRPVRELWDASEAELGQNGAAVLPLGAGAGGLWSVLAGACEAALGERSSVTVKGCNMDGQAFVKPWGLFGALTAEVFRAFGIKDLEVLTEIRVSRFRECRSSGGPEVDNGGLLPDNRREVSFRLFVPTSEEVPGPPATLLLRTKDGEKSLSFGIRPGHLFLWWSRQTFHQVLGGEPFYCLACWGVVPQTGDCPVAAGDSHVGAIAWQAIVARFGDGKYTSGRDRLRRFPSAGEAIDKFLSEPQDLTLPITVRVSDRAKARVVGAKFVKLDGPVPVDGFTEDDLRNLELEKLLIVVPAVCLPCDAGWLASVDYVSVALRSALGEEMPADVTCMACGSAQPELLELAELVPQPEDWNIGVLLRSVLFPDPAARGDPRRVGFKLSVDGQIEGERYLTADVHDGEGARGDEVNVVREAAALEWAGRPRGTCVAGSPGTARGEAGAGGDPQSARGNFESELPDAIGGQQISSIIDQIERRSVDDRGLASVAALPSAPGSLLQARLALGVLAHVARAAPESKADFGLGALVVAGSRDADKAIQLAMPRALEKVGGPKVKEGEPIWAISFLEDAASSSGGAGLVARIKGAKCTAGLLALNRAIEREPQNWSARVDAAAFGQLGCDADGFRGDHGRSWEMLPSLRALHRSQQCDPLGGPIAQFLTATLQSVGATGPRRLGGLARERLLEAGLVDRGYSGPSARSSSQLRWVSVSVACLSRLSLGRPAGGAMAPCFVAPPTEQLVCRPFDAFVLCCRVEESVLVLTCGVSGAHRAVTGLAGGSCLGGSAHLVALLTLAADNLGILSEGATVTPRRPVAPPERGFIFRAPRAFDLEPSAQAQGAVLDRDRRADEMPVPGLFYEVDYLRRIQDPETSSLCVLALVPWRLLVTVVLAPWLGTMLAFSTLSTDTKVLTVGAALAYMALNFYFLWTLVLAAQVVWQGACRLQQRLVRNDGEERRARVQQLRYLEDIGYAEPPYLFGRVPLDFAVFLYALVLLAVGSWGFLHVSATGHTLGGWAALSSVVAQGALVFDSTPVLLEMFVYLVCAAVALVGLLGMLVHRVATVFLDEYSESLLKTRRKCAFVLTFFFIANCLRFVLFIPVTGLAVTASNVCGFYLRTLSDNMAYKNW